MLKLNLALISIMFLIITKSSPKSWWVCTMSLMLLCSMSIMTLSPLPHHLTQLSYLDQYSQPLITLSILIAALMMMTSTKIIYNNLVPNKFVILNIILLMTLINCFSASNIMLFYILFETSLIPTMLIIMYWGYQPERVQASMYMMIYTVLASLPMLMMFILITNNCSSYSLTTMTLLPLTKLNLLLSLFIISGFLVKLPMFSMHLWLPKAHVEAPIAGSMVLAAILLKLGGYGIMRMSMNSLIQSNKLSSILTSMCLIGAILTSLICLRQPDLKSLIAYSSVGHMGLLLAGLMSNSPWGLTGAMMMMIAHGLCSSALFSLANISYEINHTRSLFLLKGMLSYLPTMSMWWFLLASANMAAPPSINLLSEISLITSIMSMSPISMIPLAMITFLAGAYSLHMYASTQHGPINNFTNPTSFLKNKDLLMLTLHGTPLILLILKPEIMHL